MPSFIAATSATLKTPSLFVSSTNLTFGLPIVVSTSTLASTDLALCPSLSVASTTNLCSPSPSLVLGVNSQLPSRPAFVVPAILPSTNTFISAPASALPFSVGVLSFVTLPLTSPFSTPPATLSTISLISGMLVAVSTVKLTTFEF